MQWSFQPEKSNKKNSAQKYFASEKININKAAVITCRLSHSHQRCTAATSGKFQLGHSQQSNAEECID
jgi:hypothetical protein